MAAPGSRTRPGRGPAFAVLRPVAVLWSLLLAALLALLPCAASARTLSTSPSGQETHGTSANTADPAATATTAAAPAPTVRPVAPAASPAPAAPVAPAVSVADRADGAPATGQQSAPAAGAPARPYILCTADGPGPVPGHGCSSHPFCGPESHLPNAPPQPGTAVRPQLVAPPALPAASACGVQPGSHHAPDLHALQVHRS